MHVSRFDLALVSFVERFFYFWERLVPNFTDIDDAERGTTPSLSSPRLSRSLEALLLRLLTFFLIVACTLRTISGSPPAASSSASRPRDEFPNRPFPSLALASATTCLYLYRT